MRISEEEFLEDVERLYAQFVKGRPEYTGDNYLDLIFSGKITYKKFIKIHNFKAMVPLPVPSCDCVFKELANALDKPEVDEKLFAMGEIAGFRLPMASAVLHFSNPSEFAIIDNNVIKGLRKIGWRTRTVMEINRRTINFYKYYIKKIKEIQNINKIKNIANKNNITPMRLIEASLYALGKGW